MVRLEPKRADGVRLYCHDWEAFLGADTIVAQTVTSPDVVISDVARTPGDKAVKFRVSGGTDGEKALITQTIETSGGDEETELFTIEIGLYEAVSLGEAKEYLGVRHNEHDAKIAGMIPRARTWVEGHCDLTISRRQFEQRALPDALGGIWLERGPLISVDEVAYVDSGGATLTYAPRSFAPSLRLIAAPDSAWPTPRAGEEFLITYTAGYAPGEVDDRLAAAMLALIEGEYSEGYAYPERAVKAAERCCVNLRPIL
jgi:uncharacterized phiE125 gp8 family phage protein